MKEWQIFFIKSLAQIGTLKLLNNLYDMVVRIMEYECARSVEDNSDKLIINKQ